MITVEFYFKNKFGKWVYGERTFKSVSASIRFIKYVMPKRDLRYLGFTCDSYELTEEMNERL